jgi:hypothetical protein
VMSFHSGGGRGHSLGSASGGGVLDGDGCSGAAALWAAMGMATYTGCLGKRSATTVAYVLEGTLTRQR